MQKIQESATATANEQYLSPDSDFSARQVEDADTQIEPLIESLKAIGVADHAFIIEHLQDFTTIEVRQGERGTGNFDTTNIAYYMFIGEITDEPEWDFDLDNFAWKMAVENVQGIQESLLGDQLFGIGKDGVIHYIFEAYTCLVWDKSKMIRKGYLPFNEDPQLNTLIDAAYTATQALMTRACYLSSGKLQDKVNAIDNALLGVECYLTAQASQFIKVMPESERKVSPKSISENGLKIVGDGKYPVWWAWQQLKRTSISCSYSEVKFGQGGSIETLHIESGQDGTAIYEILCKPYPDSNCVDDIERIVKHD